MKETFCVICFLLISVSVSVGDVVIPASDSLLLLPEAIERALNFNNQLQASRFDYQSAKDEKREAVRSYFPQVTFNSDMSKLESDRFDSSLVSAGLAGKTLSHKFQISQLLFDHTAMSGIHLAELRKESAHWQQVGQEQTVVFNTLSSFLEILRAEELLRVQKQRIEFANTQLKVAKLQVEAGYQIAADVSRAELERSSARRDLVAADVGYQRAQVALNRLMGLSVSERYQLEGKSLTEYNPSEELEAFQKAHDNLFVMSKKNNPSVQIAHLLVRQSEESLKSAKGEYFPTISVGGSWGYYDSGHDIFETEEWSVQGNIHIPVFDSGRKRAKISKTNNQLNAQRERYEDTVQQVESLIEDSLLLAYQESLNVVTSLEAVEVAKKNHQVVLDLYAGGMIRSLEVTEALTQLVESQTELVASRYNYLRIIAQLSYIVGILSMDSQMYQETEWLRATQFNNE